MATSLSNLASNIGNSVGSKIQSIFSGLINTVANIYSSVSKIADNILSGIKNFFQSSVDAVVSIADFVGNMFEFLVNFFVHIFIPTNEQWAEITEHQKAIGDSVESHLPFISLFNDEYKKAQETVSQTDFLVITIPEFSFSAGGISTKTNEQKVINVREKYEPYRSYVRNLLFYIVVACAFVFLIKHVLKFTSVFNSSSGGEEE